MFTCDANDSSTDRLGYILHKMLHHHRNQPTKPLLVYPLPKKNVLTCPGETNRGSTYYIKQREREEIFINIGIHNGYTRPPWAYMSQVIIMYNFNR